MTDRAACLARDRDDPLARCRDLFHIPPGLIYLDGNSLGMLPKAVPERLQLVAAAEWGEGLIRSWTEAGWWDLPHRVGARIAPLIGADADEVVATDTTSVNLFKLLVAGRRLQSHRRVVLTDAGNFPTDLYIAEGVAELLGDVALRRLPAAEIPGAIDDSVAVVALSHVDYRSAELHDMAEIGRRARAAGALTLWDLSHSAGALPVDLHAGQADLAVGCGYKYLNGGPGAPAWLFVRRDLQDRIRPPLSGWWGHAEPFTFDPAWRPAGGIARNLCGTQSALAMTALEAALEIWEGVDLAALRAKSIALAELFIACVERDCAAHGVELATPRDPARRGSHVTFRHPEGNAVMRALRARGVIGDFRSPDAMRFGITPLTLSYAEVFDAAAAIAEVFTSRIHQRPEFRQRLRVT